MKGIAKALKGANVTLSGKQKKMPESMPAPKYRLIPKVGEDRKVIPRKKRNQLAMKKTSRA